MKRCIIIAAALTLLASSCKRKEKDPEPTPICPAAIYGYAIDIDSTNYGEVASRAGTIDISTGQMRVANTIFTDWGYNSSATWNSGDKCYYAFNYRDKKLYRVSNEGLLTVFEPALNGYPISDLTFNKFTGKMNGINGQQIGEVRLSGSSYSIALVCTCNHGPINSMTVNQKNGDIYFSSLDSIQGGPYIPYYVERYVQGSASPVTVYTQITSPFNRYPVIEMQYSMAEDKIYLLKERFMMSYFYDFMRLDPLNGQIDSLCQFGGIRPDNQSSCFDSCSNTYLVSYSDAYGYRPKPAYIKHFSTSGQLLRTDSSYVFYRGLSAMH